MNTEFWREGVRLGEQKYFTNQNVKLYVQKRKVYYYSNNIGGTNIISILYFYYMLYILIDFIFVYN